MIEARDHEKEKIQNANIGKENVERGTRKDYRTVRRKIIKVKERKNIKVGKKREKPEKEKMKKME